MKVFDEELLNLRSCSILDKDFVYQTKKIAMKPYIEKIWGSWDDEFQTERFNKNFNPRFTQIVQYLEKDIGILIVEEELDTFQVDNIQILPEYQNRGIGSFLLIQIIKKARKIGKSVTLQVLKTNPDAKKLYERLGFEEVGGTEFHFQMKNSVTL